MAHNIEVSCFNRMKGVNHLPYHSNRKHHKPYTNGAQAIVNRNRWIRIKWILWNAHQPNMMENDTQMVEKKVFFPFHTGWNFISDCKNGLFTICHSTYKMLQILSRNDAVRFSTHSINNKKSHFRLTMVKIVNVAAQFHENSTVQSPRQQTW